MHSTLRLTVALAALTVACDPPALDGSPAGKTARVGLDGGVDPASGLDLDGDAGALPYPDGGVLEGGTVPALDGTAPALDSDLDGAPDALDCDPASSALGLRIAEDDLATAKGLLRAAPGFESAAWLHSSGAWRQGLLHDEADASFFAPENLENVVVEVRAASTLVGTFYPKLRQNLVLVGANAEAGGFSAYGCGVEVVEGAVSELKASVVRLTGTPGYVATTPLKRADRASLLIDEEFGIRVRVQNGTITCTVSQSSGDTTVVAQGLGTVRGFVGLFTRQTKARFESARICGLR